MAKGFGIKTAPVLNRAQRRRSILNGFIYTVVGSLGLFLLFSFLFMFFDDVREERSLHQAFSLATFFWISGAFLWVPALLISWPIVNLALIKGRAGLVVALGWGATIGGGVLCLFDLQNALAMGALGAAFGVVFSSLFWFGVYRKFPNADDTH